MGGQQRTPILFKAAQRCGFWLTRHFTIFIPLYKTMTLKQVETKLSVLGVVPKLASVS